MRQEFRAPAGAKIAVALSGGIDSAAAALLLRQAGYELMGITLHLFDGPQGPPASLTEARAVAEGLGIPLQVLDLRADFEKTVVSHFEDAYMSGWTPNPCVICNREIKFGLLLTAALEQGAEYLATGHYAQLLKNSETGMIHLCQGQADRRDQAYFLHSLSQAQLQKLQFPLGSFAHKDQVREIAESHFGKGFFRSGESRGLCFLGGVSHIAHFEAKSGMERCSGVFRTLEGEVLGPHEGYVRYTIGQKRGLKTLLKDQGGGRELQGYSVVKICPQSGDVILGPDTACYSSGLEASRPRWVGRAPGEGEWMEAKICHWGYRLKARIGKYTPEAFEGRGGLEVLFESPVRAVAPGQHVVFYDKDEVLGGALIENAN